MINIGAVIGWKFNNQDGMSTLDGKITAFPGGIPSEADQVKWASEYEAHLKQQEVQTQIDDLENSVTKRNYREYLKWIRDPANPDYKYSTDKIDKVDAEITKLRP